MTVWNERDFNIAILYWKGKITLKEALESNPMIPASSWNLRKLQYEQIYNKTRIRGNDLKPIGKIVFEKYLQDENNNIRKKNNIWNLSVWFLIIIFFFIYYCLINK